jgi:hypothetical protein
MKAGFLPKHQEKAVAKASAWAEVLGYMGSIALSCHKLLQLNAQEAQLARKVEALMKVGRCCMTAVQLCLVFGAFMSQACCWGLLEACNAQLTTHGCGVLAVLLPQDENDKQCIDGSLLRQLQLLRSARLLRLALICQDLADSMTAINDITGARLLLWGWLHVWCSVDI